MGQTKVVIRLEQRQLVAQPVFALAERGDPTPPRGHMLAQAEVEALDEGGIDLPAARCQPLLLRLQGAKHAPMPHAD